MEIGLRETWCFFFGGVELFQQEIYQRRIEILELQVVSPLFFELIAQFFIHIHWNAVFLEAIFLSSVEIDLVTKLVLICSVVFCVTAHWILYDCCL
jgi:hypothetical protein